MPGENAFRLMEGLAKKLDLCKSFSREEIEAIARAVVRDFLGYSFAGEGTSTMLRLLVLTEEVLSMLTPWHTAFKGEIQSLILFTEVAKETLERHTPYLEFKLLLQTPHGQAIFEVILKNPNISKSELTHVANIHPVLIEPVLDIFERAGLVLIDRSTGDQRYSMVKSGTPVVPDP